MVSEADSQGICQNYFAGATGRSVGILNIEGSHRDKNRTEKKFTCKEILQGSPGF